MLAHAIRLAALVPITAGAAGALTGAGFLGEAVGPATGSHLRYLSGLLLGVGLLAFWCAGDLARRGRLFEGLCVPVVIGGLARLGGLVAEGAPPWPHVLALGMELVVVPGLLIGCWAQRADMPPDAPGGAAAAGAVEPRPCPTAAST